MAGRLSAQVADLLNDSSKEDPLTTRVKNMDLSVESAKVPQPDANYLDPGPDPFVCGNCRFLVWGGGNYDLCQIVEGKIHASGACRFFAHKEDKRADAVENDEPKDKPESKVWAEGMAPPARSL